MKQIETIGTNVLPKKKKKRFVFKFTGLRHTMSWFGNELKKKQNKICNNFTAVCTWSLLEFYRIFQVQHVVRTQTSFNVSLGIFEWVVF